MNTEPNVRAAKVAKITALLQKTVARGCTPDEEAAAIRLANTLMTKYSIAPSECQPTTRRSTGDSSADFFRDIFRDERVRRAQEYAKAHAAGQTCTCDPFLRAFFTGNDVVNKGPHHSTSCPMWESSRDYNTRRDQAQKKAQERARTGRRMSHRFCDHDATPAARAKCRKENGR